MSKHWLWVPIGLAAGALVAGPKAFRRAFAPPQRSVSLTPVDLGLPEEQVWLESINGTRLHGWYIPNEGEAPAVIVLHGWGANSALMLPLARHLHEAGFHALFLDARNHGLSEHDSFVSMPRFAEDLEVAEAWLRSHPCVTSVGVIGHSVGAGAAILAASRGEGLDAVVAVSSFAHPGEMMRQQLARFPAPVLNLILLAVQRTIGYRFEDFAPRNRVGLVRVPLLLVHGDADDVVPLADLYDLMAAHPDAETLVVPGGAHSDLVPFEPYVGTILDFLDRNLRQT